MIGNSEFNPQRSDIFKGIALFTPGGDLVYCIDPYKQNRWHAHLCAVLQEMLGLSEPPHFLASCYTATIDRWFDPRTQQIQTYAEACPTVMRYQTLLNTLFGVEDVNWKPASCPEEVCDVAVLAMYRNQFPQLWQEHDLVVRYERVQASSVAKKGTQLSWSPVEQSPHPQGYVFRLFVSGSTLVTEQILQKLHHLLESTLQVPYTLKVIDIHKHPELAEVDQIAATPTLVKVWPTPAKRIVGEMEDLSKVLQLLIASDATLG